MQISISSDSVCDLAPEQIKEYKINIMPLNIALGDKVYLDNVDITTQDIFNFVSKTKILPKTSAINEFAYEDFFKKCLEGNEAAIHFTISSDISSCYENAVKAAKKFDNVYVIDSKNLSTGVGLLVLYACQLKEKGLDAKTIVQKVTERIPFVQASFVIERLDYLHKGGRCSALQLLGANILKIRPSIIVSHGKMTVGKKYRGKMKEVVVNYIKDKLEEYNDYDNEMCFITYSSATLDMIESAEAALKKYANFKNVYLTTAGSTIASHCGENTLGILYFSNKPIN